MKESNSRQALLYLMACALHGSVPSGLEVDFSELYQLSAFHSVTALVASALESGGYLTGEHMEQTVLQRWKDAKSNAIRKNILLDTERAKLFAWLEKNGIWHMPLKCSILNFLYPKVGMRQMADNDILFDKSFRSHVRDYMKDRGYQVSVYNKGVHDTYTKDPVYNFEMHVTLFDEHSAPTWAAYFINIRQRLHTVPGKEYEYRFSDEDFYIYFIAHAYKHYQASGTGIRYLADIFVYLHSKAYRMDWEMLAETLTMLQLDEFESAVRNLSLKLFSTPKPQKLTEDEEKLLTELLNSGTYGTIAQRVSREVDKHKAKNAPVTAGVKLKYVLWRLFPDAAFMKQYSPFCRRHPWSIPFMWIVRLFEAAFLRRKAIRSELNAVKKLR